MKKISDEELKFAVIISKFQNSNIFGRHHTRQTLEIPGGHREAGESITECAARELKEETGAKKFSLRPLFIYSVERENFRDYGEVFVAEVTEMNRALHYEIAEIFLLEDAPENWTYPLIQPVLFQKYLNEFC